MAKQLTAFDEESAAEALLTARATDGLPVVIPTPERVERMVAASGLGPDVSLGRVPPLNGEATIEKLAINAVMAGCRPAYFPVVVAAAKAMLQPDFNLGQVQGRTGATGPMLIVNGPIRHELDIACGIGCIGPGWHANATIGRAMRLILINIGGGRVADGDNATLGSPVKFSFCFGENEEDSPWQPYHTSRGFQATDSVVTVLAVESTQSAGMPVRSAPGERGPSPDAFVNTLAAGIVAPGGAAFSLARAPAAKGTFVTIVLGPPAARTFQEQGWTRERLQQEVWERAAIPVRERKKYAVMLAGEPEEWELDPEWDDPDVVLQAFDAPSDIQIVVAGTGSNMVIPNSPWKIGAPCSELVRPTTAV